MLVVPRPVRVGVGQLPIYPGDRVGYAAFLVIGQEVTTSCQRQGHETGRIGIGPHFAFLAAIRIASFPVNKGSEITQGPATVIMLQGQQLGSQLQGNAILQNLATGLRITPENGSLYMQTNFGIRRSFLQCCVQ